MNYKTFIQIILLFIILFILTFIYFEYFKTKKPLNQITKQTEKIINEKQLSVNDEDQNTNTLKNILYEKFDSLGNKYTITSMYGKFTNDDRINITLDDVLGYLNLKNGEIIFFKSNNAKYNTLTGDSNFYGNVNSNYLNHEMNSDYLDVFFENKKLEAYGNLIYTNNEYKLSADKAILDFITKNLEIFMLDDTQVKVINKN
tara:strand:- start:2846 stop:3448 length:603 start_codon:yes stop_codon:yes gene_type:complete